MSVLLVKVLWYKVKDRNTEAVGDNIYESPSYVSDSVLLNSGKGLDIKNNILSLVLKNNLRAKTVDPDNNEFLQSRYVDKEGNLKFSEQDQVKVFAKYTNDGVDVGSASWGNDPNSNPGNTYLIGVYYVTEFNPIHSSTQTRITLKCADKAYVLFNRVLAKAFTETDGLTAPQMIQKIVRYCSQNPDGAGRYSGTSGDAGVTYDVDARLVSESNGGGTGYVTDTRKSTREDGSSNPDTTFPTVSMAKVWKPIYEWIKDLSQIEVTNTQTELGDILVYGRPFIFWVDPDNKFHWVYPSDTVDNTITVGTDTVYSVNLTKRVFDVTNMIIYNCGTDMYNTGILDYAVDLTSNVKALKMRYVPFTDISKKWISKDYSEGTLATDREGTPAGNPIPQFPKDAQYPLSSCAFVPTTNFSSASDITDDSDYNDCLWERCLMEGKNKAEALLKGLSHARWKGNIMVKGGSYTPGNLIKLYDTRLGLNGKLIRIMDVKHNFTKSVWQTTLELEQDPETIVQGG